jgi:hypothetical protein
MQGKPLHIVSFDNPYPPVYGGVIDVYYKLKALHALGFEIYLHCFVDTKLPPHPSLLAITKETHFYRRKKKQSGYKLFSIYPFAVYSRYRKELFANISKVSAPILFEGQQTSFLAKKHNLQDRKLLLRLHNLEANYFLGQARSETNWFKKAAYFSEYVKYKLYQRDLKRYDAVLALSHFEQHAAQRYSNNVVYVPVFHGNDHIARLSEFGKYAIYHGDLRLADNRRAVKFLINVFKKIADYPLVIASGKHGDFVEKWIADAPNISHIEIDNDNPMHLTQLLADAHINVMLSFQESGTKLKVVNSLFRSRFCIINKNMLDDETLRDLCTMAETEQDFIDAVNHFKTEPFLHSDKRSKALLEILDDHKNAQKIAEMLTP